MLGASWLAFLGHEDSDLGDSAEPLAPSGGQDTYQGFHRPTLGLAF